MNRPLWLDILYLGGFLAPPIVIAAVVTTAIAQWMGWSDLVLGLVYLVSVPISLVIWLAGLVLWSRRSRKSPSRDEHEPK